MTSLLALLQPLGPPRATWRDLISEQRVFSFKPAGIQELPRNLTPVQKHVLNPAQGTSPAMQRQVAFLSACICPQACEAVRPSG